MKTSILVSMYNKKQEVIEAIDKMFLPSLIRNGSKEKELIILDDCSPLKKETEKIINKHLSELRKKFSRVVFSRNTQNLGFAKSYNKAISLAKGEYLVITNDDIYFPKENINLLVSTLSKDKKIGICGPITVWHGAGTYQDSKQSPILKEYSKQNFKKIEDFSEKIKNLMKNENPKKVKFITGFCFAIRKEIIEKIGGYDETYGFGYLEDTDLMKSVIKQAEIVVNPSVYIHHGAISGVSGSFNQRKIKSIISRLRNILRYIKKWHDLDIFRIMITSFFNYYGYNTVSDLIEEKIKNQ